MSKARNIADLGSNDVLDTDGTGATVSGHLTVSDSTPDFVIQDTDGTNQLMKMQQVGGASMIKFRSDTNDGELYFTGEVTGNNKMKIATNGDITMYKDDGSSTGVFFDASAARLAVNTNSPTAKFHVEDTGFSLLRVENTNASYAGATWMALFEDDGTVDKSSGNYMLYLNSKRPVTSSGSIMTATTSGGASHVFSVHDSGEVVVNESSISTSDFRVESDTQTHMLFVDAGNSRIGIAKSGPDYGIDSNVDMRLNASGATLYIGNGSGTSAPYGIGSRSYGGYAHTGVFANSGYGAASASLGLENSLGAYTPYVQVNSNGSTSVNEAGSDHDFRVESASNTHALFVDAGNNRVGISNSSPAYGLDIGGDYPGNNLRITRGTNSFVTSLSNNIGGTVYVGTNVASPLSFQTDSTDRLKIDTNGDVQFLNSGGNVRLYWDRSAEGLVSSGAGISFDAGSNYLDDYEEGTFTPVVADATSGGNTASLVAEYGFYTKIGRQVTVHLSLADIDTTGMTGTNILYIRDIPFVANNTTGRNVTGAVRVDKVNVDPACIGVVALMSAGTTQIQIYQNRDATTDIAVLVNTLNSGTADIFVTLTYDTT